MASKISVPTYNQGASYTGAPSQHYSIPGEKSNALNLQFVPDTKFSSVGKALSDIGDRVFKAEMIEGISKGVAAGTKSENDLLYKSATDKEYVGLSSVEAHEKKFSEEWDTNFQNILDNTENAYARRELESRFNVDKANAMSKARLNARTHLVSNSTATAGENINNYSQLALRVGLTDLKGFFNTIDKIRFEYDKLIALSPDKRAEIEAIKRNTEETLKKELVKQMIDADPENAINSIVDDEASLSGAFNSLSQEHKSDMINYAGNKYDEYLNNKAKVEKETDKQYKAYKKEVENSVVDRYIDEKLTVDDLDKLWSNRLISRELYTSYRDKLIKAKTTKDDNNTLIDLNMMKNRKDPLYKQAIEDAIKNGNLSEKTAKTLKNNADSIEVKKAEKEIEILNPSHFLATDPMRYTLEKVYPLAVKHMVDELGKSLKTGKTPHEISEETLRIFTPDDYQKQLDMAKKEAKEKMNFIQKQDQEEAVKNKKNKQSVIIDKFMNTKDPKEKEALKKEWYKIENDFNKKYGEVKNNE